LNLKGVPIGYIGGTKTDGDWKQITIEEGEKICGIYGTVSVKNNLVSLGFILWTPKTSSYKVDIA